MEENNNNQNENNQNNNNKNEDNNNNNQNDNNQNIINNLDNNINNNNENQENKNIKSNEENINEKESKGGKKICCVEFPNNTQIFINYESNWTVKDLIKAIIKHKIFIDFYPNKNYIFNSSRNLILFDLHLCIYRQIKTDYENKISFDIKIDDLYSKGLIHDFPYPFFLFKDNRTPLTFPYSPNKIKNDLIKNIIESNFNFSTFYSLYLPRTNTINLLNTHPEISDYYDKNKKNYNEFNKYNLNTLIGNEEKYDWFYHDNESLNFLIEMNSFDINIKSLKKIINGKIYFEDKVQIYPEKIKEITDDDLKDFFVNITYLVINELDQKDIFTKKMKITTKTTALELIESTNKRVELMKKELKFDSSKKILKVKSLSDYIFDLNEPLIHYNYLIECVKLGKEAEYIIIHNPEFIVSNNQMISEYQKPIDNLFNFVNFNPEKLKNEYDNDVINKQVKNIENEKQNDDLDNFIDILLNEIKINEQNKYQNINNENIEINNNENDNLMNNEISIFGDSVINSNNKYEYDDIKLINEKLNTGFSLINNLTQSTIIKGTSVMGSKKRKTVNQPNIYIENKEIDIKKMVQIISSNIAMRDIERPFSILLNGAYLNKIFNSFDCDNGNFLTYLIFKIQLFCGKKPFNKPKIIKWKTYSKDVNPIFNKRIYFDNYNIIPYNCSIMFEIKYVQYNRIKEIISNETKYWGNFNLFDYSKRLRTGQHIINLYESLLNEDSYFRFIDNQFDENPSKIYFEIESFTNNIINKVLHIQNYSLDIESIMVSQSDNEKIKDILLKTPSEELNNYDKEVLWTNRFKLMENPKIISRLISCFNYNEPRHLIELEKLIEISKRNLNTIQAMELLNGYSSYDSLRNYAVECLRKAPIEEINQYLYQLIQGLKYEFEINNELAKFLIEISVNYPFTIGHKFYWYLRSEMKNKFFRQKFALYLNVFLNKIGEDLCKIFFDEDFLLKNLLKLTNIMNKKKLSKQEKIQLFKDSLNAFNELLKASNREISLPFDYKKKINFLITEKCKIKENNEKSFYFTFNNSDPLSEEIDIILNTNKDLRLDMIILQIFNSIRNLWFDNNLQLKMSLYNVITTDYNQGLIEILNNTEKLSVIMTHVSKKIHFFKKDNPIKNWLEVTCKIPSEEYYKNFLVTVSSYLVCDFVLGINDRNNDNIRLKFNGELFNIDFNNLFGINENYELEKSVCNMVFNKDFMGVLESGKVFKEFKNKIWVAYSILRENKEILFSFFKILIISGVKEIDEKYFKYLELSLNLIEKNEKKIKQFFEKKFKESQSY